MATLIIENLKKSYDGKTQILKDISFTVKDGELVSILGSSGCGKTTTLRAIAGLTTKNSGKIKVNNKEISNVPVYQRNFGMVFQSYALFPHLNVFENVAFGLKMQRVSKSELKKRVDEILQITGLCELAKRYPAELSGGQQQRVSLARALVIKPKILLMDEPLSNLDAKLRVKMREEIRRLQQKFHITTLFVTHDQQECFAISDRVLLMNKGKVEQFDTPENIFNHPQNEFVARFIGYENFINCKNYSFNSKEDSNHARLLTIRPERIEIVGEPEGENIVTGKIIQSEFLGTGFCYLVKTKIGNLKVIVTNSERIQLGNNVNLKLSTDYLLPLI